jgi:hypothetical protein
MSLAFSGVAVAGELPSAHAPSAPTACDELGQGFAALVGTDTCLKIGGRIRADFFNSTFRTEKAPVAWPKAASPKPVDFRKSNSGFRTTGEIVLDTRTATELGTVHTHVEIRAIDDR